MPSGSCWGSASHRPRQGSPASGPSSVSRSGLPGMDLGAGLSRLGGRVAGGRRGPQRAAAGPGISERLRPIDAPTHLRLCARRAGAASPHPGGGGPVWPGPVAGRTAGATPPGVAGGALLRRLPVALAGVDHQLLHAAPSQQIRPPVGSGAGQSGAGGAFLPLRGAASAARRPGGHQASTGPGRTVAPGGGHVLPSPAGRNGGGAGAPASPVQRGGGDNAGGASPAQIPGQHGRRPRRPNWTDGRH